MRVPDLVAVAVVVLAGCWTSGTSHPEPPASSPVVASPPPKDPEPDVTCPTFEASDPACESACPDDAPDDWRGCVRLAVNLQGHGYTCRSLHPRTCRRLPPGVPQRASLPGSTSPSGHTHPAVPLVARLLTLSVDGDRVVITFNAGQREGVTLAWKARIVSRGADGSLVPVQDGEVTLTNIGPTTSTGAVWLPVTRLRRTPFVHLER